MSVALRDSAEVEQKFESEIDKPVGPVIVKLVIATASSQCVAVLHYRGGATAAHT